MADRDRNYDDYYRKWKDRLGLSDRHFGEGYIHGLAPPHDRAASPAGFQDL